MQNKLPAYQYYQAQLMQVHNLIILESVNEFIRYTSQHHLQNIFNTTWQEQNYFSALHQSSVIASLSHNYKTIQDYAEAHQTNFPDAQTYYDAKTEGYSNYNDYVLIKEAGIGDIKTFEKIKSLGYITGYEEFKQLRLSNETFPETEKITNPFKLYKHATTNFFTDYAHFNAALQKGFTDARTFASATEKELKNYTDYKNALDKGFLNGSDYYRATEISARDHSDFIKWTEFEYSIINKESHDKRILFSIISKLPQNKKISVNKINDLLNQNINDFKYPDTSQLPQWLTISLNKIEDVSQFLLQNEEIKKFGTYDNEGEFFETKHLNQRKVIIDGANVAYNSHGNEKAKPTVENLLMLVKELISKNFNDITVIADASLKHHLIDREKLTDLEKLCFYYQAPAEMQADIFLINFVKTERCLLITNDTFRDWKKMDAWVAENIDYYKMTFMINGNVVLLPDLDQPN
jgi:Zc3h12a-like Ribonuclease NYN domain